MRLHQGITTPVGCVLVALALVGLASPASGGTLGAELSARVATAAPNELLRVIVTLRRQAVRELPPAEPSRPEPPRAELRRLVTEYLVDVHTRTQRPLAALVEAARAAGRARDVRQYWLVNAMSLEATADVIEALAADPAVDEVSLSILQSIVEIVEDGTEDDPDPPAVNGIRRIRAPQVWSLGNTGVGAVIGVIDSGARVNHPDLAGRWRGGSNSWMDFVDPDETTPVDPFGHGTHVTGTILGGNEVGSNYIGVAHGAKYIACRWLDRDGFGDQAWALGCMDWMANPDEDPATDDLPDAVNMSWRWPAYQATCNQYFRAAVQGWVQLGIFPIAAAGNEGVPEIPAAYPEVRAVGAVDRQNEVTDFSGRGPSPCDATIYPELAAPGTKVRSAWPGGVRKNLRGTSMAAPHVAGTVALLRSHRPNLTVGAIFRILKATAVDLGPAGSDNAYGFGMVDAYRAFLCLDHGTYSGCGAQCP